MLQKNLLLAHRLHPPPANRSQMGSPQTLSPPGPRAPLFQMASPQTLSCPDPRAPLFQMASLQRLSPFSK
jgi:hypothetical protein